MSGSFDVLGALQQGAQGKFAPPPGMATAAPSYARVPLHRPPGASPDSTALTDLSDADYARLMGGQGAPPANAAPPPPPPDTEPQAPPAFDVLGALQQGTKGKFQYTPPPEPPSTTLKGALANTAAGGNETIANALGAPVDLLTGGINLGVRGLNALAGTAIPQITNPVGGSASLESLMGLGGFDPRMVKPATESEAALRAAGGAVASLPMMAMGGTGAASLLGGSPVLRGIAQSVGETPVGAAAAPVAMGAGVGQMAQDAVPGPLKPYANIAGNVFGAGVGPAIAGGFRGLTGAVGNAGVGRKIAIGADTGAPMQVTSAQANEAAARLHQALGPDFQQAVQTVNAAPEEIIPGVPRTTAQVTADRPEGKPIPAVAGLEVSARNRNPAPFINIENQQRDTMARNVAGMRPKDADPQALADYFIRGLDQRENSMAASVGAQRSVAQNAVQQLGTPGTPEEIGGATRSAVQEALEPVQQNRRSLYDVLEADQNSTLPSQGVKDQAVKLLKEHDPSVDAPLSAGEARVIAQAAALPPVVAFGKLSTLRRQIGDLLRPSMAGEPLTTAGQRRLILLKEAIDGAIKDAVTHAAGQNDGFATLLREEAGAAGAARPAASMGQLPAEGTAGSADGGGNLGTSAGPPLPAKGAGGVPPGETEVAPTFGPEAAANYQKARTASAEEHRVFGRGPVGAILAKGAKGEPFNLADSKVMSQFLSGKDVGEKYGKLVEAVGPEKARQLVGETIVRELHDTGVIGPDGTLNAEKYAGWQKGPRGRLINEIPGLRGKLDTAAKAQEYLDNVEARHAKVISEYRKGVAGRFLAKDGLPPDPGEAVKAALNGPRSGHELTRIINAVQGDPDALAGLRAAVADYLTDRFTTVSEVGADAQADFTKSETFRNFINNNRDALRRLYPGNGGQSLQRLEQIAAELRRMKLRAVAAEGSPTATYFQQSRGHGMSRAEKGGHTAFASLIGAGIGEQIAEHIGAGGLAGTVAGAVVLPAVSHYISALRQAGIETVNDLISFSMQHPSVFKELTRRVGPDGKIGPIAKQQIGKAIRAALVSDAVRPHEDDDK